MQNQNYDQSSFKQISEQQLTKFVYGILNPENDATLKQKSKQFFEKISQILNRTDDIAVLQKISKFIMALIMLGHLHILHMFDRYLLTSIIYLSDSILKLSPLSPIRDRNQFLQPNRWKNQFAREILYLLAKWFPYDFINVQQESRYLRISKNKKIKLNGFFILGEKFITQTEDYIDTLDIQSQGPCQHCIRCYQKLKTMSNIDKISTPPSSNNAKISQINSEPPPSMSHQSQSCLIEPFRLKKLKENKKQQRQISQLQERLKQKILKNKTKKLEKKKQSFFDHELSVMDASKVFRSV